MGTALVIPSPLSNTIPDNDLKLLLAYNARALVIFKQKDGTEKVSKNTSVIFSLFYLGFIVDSVIKIGHSSGLIFIIS